MGIDYRINEIISSSQIPSERRRREVLRELQAHIEDFVLCARSAGHTQAEAERMAFASFGDPQQIALQFGWVYRQQRAALHISVFLLSTITVALAISVVVMSLKAGVAIGFRVPLLRMFSAHHTMIEVADILASVTAYLGLISLEKLFKDQGFRRAAAALSFIFAVLIALFWIVAAPWAFLVFGLVIAIFLHTVQTRLKSPATRTAVVLGCFSLFGLISLRPMNVASWLASGAGYLAMTDLATRVDRFLYEQYL